MARLLGRTSELDLSVEAKSSLLNLAQQIGLFRISRYLRRNSKSLLILCYHGVSKSDEHKWKPSLYISPEVFRERLRTIRSFGYEVIPLSEALRRLNSGSLSGHTVVITFDDGWHDFYTTAWPILKEFDYPATVYQTTYYTFYNRPVFDTACSYLLWRARGTVLSDATLTGSDTTLKLDSMRAIDEATLLLRNRASEWKFSAEEKDLFLKRLADRLHIDFDQILSSRTLHLMNPSELAQVSRGQVDVELHTHRHRLPSSQDVFLDEIARNRELIRQITGKRADHFCYPNGAHRAELPAWLELAGVRSATTCDPGMVTRESDILLLPRVTDSTYVSQARFESWLAGIGLIGKHGRKRQARPTSITGEVLPKSVERELRAEDSRPRSVTAS